MKWFLQSFSNLTKFEKNWLVMFSTIIMLTTFYFSGITTDYTNIWSVLLNWVVSPVSAITGVFCVVLVAKGKLQNYIWGFANSFLYGIVAWTSGYLGDWMVNWFYFLPTQVFIFLAWRKNMSADGIVTMKRLKNWKAISLGIGIVVATYLFALFLMGVDNFFTQAMKRSSAFYGNLNTITGIPMLGPLMDSATVVLQVVAELLMIFMYAEQWPLWIAVNVITSIIWGIVIFTDPTSIGYAVPTLVMWLAFLCNSCYGTYVWYKNSLNPPAVKEWVTALKGKE